MKRNWTIDADDYETEDDFRADVARELASLELMGHRLGLGFTVAPMREKRPSGEVIIHGWTFESASIPLLGQARPRPVAVPEPEPVSPDSPGVREPEPLAPDEAA